MPQADYAFASITRRPAVRAAALLWIWLTVVFAPIGATLHTMSHLRPAGGADAAVSTETAIGATAIVDPSHADSPWAAAANAPDDDASPQDAHHDAAAHCHVCDEWQFLDHALPSAAQPDVAERFGASPRLAAVPVRVFAEPPWILPRAPPLR